MGIFFIALLVPVHPAIVSVPSFQYIMMMMYCDAWWLMTHVVHDDFKYIMIMMIMKMRVILYSRKFRAVSPENIWTPDQKVHKDRVILEGRVVITEIFILKEFLIFGHSKCVSLPNMWHLLPTWEAKWHCLLHPGSWGVISPQLTLF